MMLLTLHQLGMCKTTPFQNWFIWLFLDEWIGFCKINNESVLWHMTCCLTKPQKLRNDIFFCLTEVRLKRTYIPIYDEGASNMTVLLNVLVAQTLACTEAAFHS